MRWVSLQDLVEIPEIKEVIMNDDLGAFYDILYTAGFDINQGIEYDPSYCRSLKDHRVIHFGRFIAEERVDDEWAESGMMTEETRKRIIGKKDVSLLREIEMLGRESNFTGEIVAHLSNYWGDQGATSQAIIEVGS